MWQLTLGISATMHVTATQPLVSIIIPCYNCEKWVRQAVEVLP